MLGPLGAKTDEWDFWKCWYFHPGMSSRARTITVVVNGKPSRKKCIFFRKDIRMFQKKQLHPRKTGTCNFENHSILQSEIHSGNLTQQWKMDPLKMYFLSKMGIFQAAMLVYQRVHPQMVGFSVVILVFSGALPGCPVPHLLTDPSKAWSYQPSSSTASPSNWRAKDSLWGSQIFFPRAHIFL